jgi:hypothetical protein
MERFGEEFLTNDCTHTSGAVDADGNTICGTPGAANQEPQPVNTVRFVAMPQLVAPGESAPFVAQAWNSQGEGPEGSTMRFSIVSSGTQIVSIAPLTATMTASGTATVTVTGLTTGTAVLVAQWFGNLGGTEIKVAYPPPVTPTVTVTPTTELPVECTHCIYLPLILKTSASVSQLPPRGPYPAQAAVFSFAAVSSAPGALHVTNLPAEGVDAKRGREAHAEHKAQVAVWTRSVPLGEAVALVQRPGQ